ncbi:diguanylate cyclase [Scytonema sp. UIC 10036]|uniref:sensor domain-containing diguanylate cyclase n=1 Tax=Scytonema sp. UIC 10036 TaxID=2304196 RepID=UPI0012DA3ABB|nr:sensor domain-containing diguanylate cyclase [Scytonema sp. UIC 10036]MUH01159.1 diguanylate cyclase [Scytonema sp. UIC 10036]
MIPPLSIAQKHCYSQKPEVFVLELISNVLVVLATYSIAAGLMYFVCKRKDLPDTQIFLLFGVLLIACGIDRIIDVWTFWHRRYWLSGGIEALAACVALCAAIRLLEVISQALADAPFGSCLKSDDRKRLEQALQESEAKQIALRQQAEREHLVSQLTQRIRQSLSIEEVLNTAVAEVRQLLQADRALVYQIMADGTGTVISEAVATNIPMIAEQPLPEKIFPQENYQLYYEGRIRIIADIEQDEITPCLAETLRQLGVRSKIVIPILGQDRLWGLLIAHQCQAPRYWQQWEADLLRQISGQLAIAIHQADLYCQIQTDLAERQQTEFALRRALEREQQAIHRERLIGIIAQNIRQFLHLDSILTTTVEEVRQFLQVDRVVIYQFDADWHGTVIAESISDPSFSILGQNVQDPCFQKTISHSYFQGRIHAVNDVLKANLDPCYVNLLTTLQVRAVLVLPVVIHQKLWGLLIAHHCAIPYHWQQATWHLLRQLSTQLAIAIQQSELYQQLEQANRELKRLATLDGLTQIANRRSFDECLDREWQRSNREQSPLSLLLCDIDYFKLYNDYYGHQAGDNCLQQFAQTLNAVVKRPTDLVARYGGEEFAILLPNTDTTGALKIAEQIQQAVAQLQIPHVRSDVSQCITVSIGIGCLSPTQELLPQDLIAIADQALYEAKANGRNRYKVGSHSQNFEE